jgi:uncharacterized cupredoxin-like copper-binding protein
MSFLDDDDDTFTELAEEERRRQGRRRSLASSSIVKVILLLVAVVIVVAIGGILIRNWMHNREVSSYSGYVDQVTSILKDSDKTGAELTALLVKPGDATRKDVQTQLDQYIATSNRLTDQAKLLAAPSDLREAQQWFIATMQLRSRGVENLKPALLNALEVQDVSVSSEQISRAMQLLVLSDVAYGEFFVTRASSVLKERNISNVTVPSTKFITSSSLSTPAAIKELLTTLKSSSSLQTVHGVALTKVVVMPSEKVIAAGSTYNLQASDQLAFVITVENQGNMTEKDVPVTLKLTGPSSTQPQIQTVKIPEIKAKESKQVTITGINPTDYGQQALLHIEAGPVPGEKNLANNVLEAHVIFVL